MKCPKCSTLYYTEGIEVCTGFTVESYNPREIGKLIFSKLVQCPECREITLLTIDQEPSISVKKSGEK